MTGSGPSDDESPDAVVRSVIAALNERRWDDVLRAVDPAELDRWRRNVLAAAQRFFADDRDGAQAQWEVGGFNELEPLSAEDLFCRWLAASSPESRMRAAFRTPDPPPGPSIVRTVLGSVREGDAVAHVVYRESRGAPGDFRAAPRIATLRHTRSGWKMVIDYQMMGNLGWHVAPARPALPAQTPGQD